MKRTLLAPAVMFVLLLGTFSSCKKETPDTDTQSGVDNSICETEFSKSMSAVNGFAMNENGVRAMQDVMSGNPAIIVDPADTLNGFPVTMTIDYGTAASPTTDAVDGKIRSGKIVCVFSDHWSNVGAEVKVTFVDYKVNAWSYGCDSMKITHSATNAFTRQVYKGVCSNGSVSLKWEGTHTVTQTAGYSTPLNVLDDVYSLTGNATGLNREGKSYSVAITTAVVKRTSCHWVESGRMDITPEGLAVRTLDYGDGTCDAKATITINGNTFTFNMD